jgi:hypothetical protein
MAKVVACNLLFHPLSKKKGKLIAIAFKSEKELHLNEIGLI